MTLKKGDKVQYAQVASYWRHTFRRQYYHGVVTRVYDHGHKANILCDGYPEFRGLDMWWLIPIGGDTSPEQTSQMKGYPAKSPDVSSPISFDPWRKDGHDLLPHWPSRGKS